MCRFTERNSQNPEVDKEGNIKSLKEFNLLPPTTALENKFRTLLDKSLNAYLRI